MNAIIILSVAAAAFSIRASGHELQFVTFVHRHGDRSPVGSYPNDPYGNESLWNNGWGELTTAGKQRTYTLGKWLRERYTDFLPKLYNKNDYEVQSTDYSRTLMSAYLVSTGLYEPTGSDVWHPNITWQPIPVHTMPRTLDNVIALGKPCPRHKKLMLQLMLSKEITTQLNAETLSEVLTHAGYNSSNILTNLLNAVVIYDSLLVQHQNGLELPKWSRPYFPQPLKDIGSLILRIRAYNKPLQRLSFGLLVKDILEHFKAKSTGMLSKKIWQYSAHDQTIMGLRQCLGLNETDLPGYASALILEFSFNDGQYYVKVLYKNENTLTTYVIPGCSEYCPLNAFEQLVTPIIPEDWEAECKL